MKRYSGSPLEVILKKGKNEAEEGREGTGRARRDSPTLFGEEKTLPHRLAGLGPHRDTPPGG